MRRWLLLLGALVLAGCGYAAAPAPYRAPALTDHGTVDGRILYARDCAWCHGAAGEGTTRAPDLNGPLDGGAYTNFMLTSGRMPLATPATRPRRGPSPFSEEQISQLVAYVQGLGGTGPPVPHPDLQAGDVGRGEQLYLTNCAACHSSTGIGGALPLGRAAANLTNPDVTPTQVAEAMLVGPGCANTNPVCGPGSGAMPRFDFTPAQVDDIVAYVSYLQQAKNPGGWSVGRVGPVTEGAVAWLLGIGLILSLGRWIGTRVGEEE